MQQNYIVCSKARWSNFGYGNILSCPKGKKFPKDKKACKDCQQFKSYSEESKDEKITR